MTVEFLDTQTSRWFPASQAATITPRAVRVTFGRPTVRAAALLQLPMVIPMGQQPLQLGDECAAVDRHPARRGVAMIAALWLVVAISVVALPSRSTPRSAGRSGINAAERAGRPPRSARWPRRRPRSTTALRRTGRTSRHWPAPARAIPGWVWIRSSPGRSHRQHARRRAARDLGTQLNINDLKEDQLKAFFGYTLNDYVKADQLAHTIIDWRDLDDIARLDGDEIDGYMKKGLLALPANGPFRR